MKSYRHYANNCLELEQFFRFCAVGISNTCVYFFVYYLLLFLGIDYLLANFLGWVVSVGNAYFWNHKYVFRSSRLTQLSCVLRGYVSYAVTLLLSTVGLYVMVQYFGFSLEVAPWGVYFITVPLNYLLNRYWVFPK